MTRRFAVLALAFASQAAIPAFAEQSAEAQAVFAEAKKELGAVPTLLRVLPDELVAPVWEQVGALEMNPNTAINGKTKELIGAGVAAQIPCHYCGYFHARAAKLNGATEKELKEAIAVAALTRHWATVSDTFTEASPDDKAPSAEVQAVYAEIEKAMGSVPPFMRRYPQSAIGAAWKGYKALGSFSLPAKDRALISLAVSAQIPSPDCAKFYAGAARKAGASSEEVSEAVAMAALTRAGSTVLNGSLVDEAAYRRETDQIVRHVKEAMKKEMAQR